MKKSTVILIVILGAVVLLCGMGCSKYNNITPMAQEVDAQWSNVETQYQRRADLIPNLQEIVKGYAAHEKSTFEAVTEARAKAGSINISAENLNEETLRQFTAAQSQLTSAMKSLLAVSEAYPELKANENFLKFQDEYAGTENRIQTARRDYNETAKKYNTEISLFPTNIFASLFGFDKKPYFSATEGAENAPRVQF